MQCPLPAHDSVTGHHLTNTGPERHERTLSGVVGDDMQRRGGLIWPEHYSQWDCSCHLHLVSCRHPPNVDILPSLEASPKPITMFLPCKWRCSRKEPSQSTQIAFTAVKTVLELCKYHQNGEIYQSYRILFPGVEELKGMSQEGSISSHENSGGGGCNILITVEHPPWDHLQNYDFHAPSIPNDFANKCS